MNIRIFFMGTMTLAPELVFFYSYILRSRDIYHLLLVKGVHMVRWKACHSPTSQIPGISSFNSISTIATTIILTYRQGWICFEVLTGSMVVVLLQRGFCLFQGIPRGQRPFTGPWVFPALSSLAAPNPFFGHLLMS